ncbi:MAG: glutamate--tRNA ligase family protein, partial [Saprospiraceae bacterium]|nr:glutamate--tRNA ligase family protein [Saprospiraceae bacterium]
CVMEALADSFFAFIKTIHPGARLRLAPTPSGFLHQGNAFNFILNWLAARVHRDAPAPQLLLRIDDLDADRKRPEYVQDIFDSLAWLGLDWDGEPVFQSTASRLPIYENILLELRARDRLFACRKSRRELAFFQGDYPLEFRQQGLSLETHDAAWRIRYHPDSIADNLTDFIVRRRDGVPAYQIASLADDLEMGITHIIRGADLSASTRAQQFIARELSVNKFLEIKILHHPLLLDNGGEKLSKSAGAASLKTMREGGHGPEPVFRLVGDSLGLAGDSARTLLLALRQMTCND